MDVPWRLREIASELERKGGCPEQQLELLQMAAQLEDSGIQHVPSSGDRMDSVMRPGRRGSPLRK